MAAYQVIARKYRPQRFQDVVGQEHVTETLAHAIEQKRIAHAYLFCGPRGTGKTTIARIFAKCLNATGGPKVDFADDDPRAREITEGRSLDVLEIDGASNNSVEQVRDLRETCQYVPASSKFKIYIIDEVHMLSTAAFNALLKTLEEPPEHVKFLFATTDPEKVLPTILSRCQRFDLRRIPAALIAKHLKEIATKEKVKIDDAALHAIARGSEGAMRDAESTLDQLISFCGGQIEEQDVLSMFGLTGQAQLHELSLAILEADVQKTLRSCHDLANRGKDLGRLLSDLLNHFRNLLISKVSEGDLSMLEISESEAAAISQQAKLASAEALTRIMEVLADADLRLRDASSKKTMLEVSLLKAIEARNMISVEALLKQLHALQEQGSNVSGSQTGGLGAARKTPKVQTASEPVSETRHTSNMPALSAASDLANRFSDSVISSSLASSDEERVGRSSVVLLTKEEVRRPLATSAPNLIPMVQTPAALIPTPITTSAVPISEDLEPVWNQLLASVGHASQFTRSYLNDAHPISFARNIFTIGFDPIFEDHLSMVDNSKTQGLLQTKMEELGYLGVQFKFVKAPAPAGRLTVQPAQVVAPAKANPGPARSALPARPKPGLAVPPTEIAAAGILANPNASTGPGGFDKASFKNDPLIQKALEIFKGQIVEIRQ
jgi:DNA polymerase-3 subunit gamma/tau